MSTSPTRPSFSWLRMPTLWVAIAAVAAFFLVTGARNTQAESKGKVDIAYISVLGEGPIARAWYDGAPSPGVPVQDALDHFAAKGYVVARITDALRTNNNANDSAFAILLQRVP